MDRPFTQHEAVEVKGYVKFGGNISRGAEDKLYEYWFEQMPYGVAKARDGDPFEWINDQFSRMDELEIDDWVDNRTEVK